MRALGWYSCRLYLKERPISLPGPVSMYRRIRDAAHQADPHLCEWLATATPSDWESLAWLVGNQFAAVDLYHHLSLTGALDLVPQEERGFFECCAKLAVKQELRYREDVTRMLNALNAQGITATLLKGSALISGGYFPRSGQRYIGDIDFIVHPGKLDAALNALEQRGFELEFSLPRPVEAYWYSKHDLPSIWHKQGFFRLECHAKPMNKTLMRTPPLDSNSMVESATCVEIDGGQVNIPCPEHLVVHAFYHSQLNDMFELAGTDNYRAMIDVSTVVERTGGRFDWAYVNELIGSINATNSFALFVERIAYCVDSRACQWPVGRDNIKHRKRVYSFFKNHRRVSLATYAMARFGKEMCFALSRDRRTERRILFEANPADLRFAPRWRQLLSPSIWTERVRWFTRMAGFAN